MGDAKRDNNNVTTLLGVSSADGITPVVIWVDPVTHRVLVDLGSAGDVVGPASAVNNNFAAFDTTTGKLIKDSGYNAASFQAALGFTAENVANKATTFGTINDTLYPTVKAVNDAITTAVVGLLDYRGSYDASTNLFPATGGSGTAGAILKGDFWICSVAGTLGGTAVTAGDLIIALVDTPAQTAANWDLIQHDLNNAYLLKAGGTMTGDILGAVSYGATGTRVVKVWATNIETTNEPTVGGVQTKLLLAGGTMTGKTVSAGRSEVGKTYTPATGAQTVALDCAVNNMHIVSGHASGTAITFTVANATDSQPFIVSILQGGTTVSTITAWFATVRWAGGVAPTLTATLNKRDTFGFIRTGANTYDGFIIGQNC